MKFSYQTGFFICIILVTLLLFKDIYKTSFQFTLEKNSRGSDVNLDNYEDLFYSIIDSDSSLNSTMMDTVISRLYISTQSTLSILNKRDIENILDQNVNITNSNKVNIRVISSTFTYFYKGWFFFCHYTYYRQIKLSKCTLWSKYNIPLQWIICVI